MATVLKIQSFSENNIRERSSLSSPSIAGALELHIESTDGYAAGNPIYVGVPSREGCEKAIIDEVIDATHISVVAALKLPHSAFEPVMSVLGDLIKIHRAANVDGTVPADELFTVLATRNIDPDQPMTYYTDSAGSASFWYRSTYFNQATNEQTSLQDSSPVRGDDFGHYASLSEIRNEAGFKNAVNLSDVDVDAQRRAAEAEINVALAARYAVPFKPVPEIIHTITIKLAAAFLVYNAYRTKAAQTLIDDARRMLEEYGSGDVPIVDGDGTDITNSAGVSYDFGDEPRSFTIGQRF